MQDKFSYDSYVELLRNQKNEYDDRAYNYAKKFIPTMLYKYMSVESEEDSLKKRNRRLKALKEEKIWASHANILNDPFELKLFKYDLNNESVFRFNEEVMKAIEIISLSGTPLDKLMWSHYSNGHTGICLEYEYNGHPATIFPIEYYDTYDRCDVTNIIEKWMKDKQLLLEGKLSAFDVRCDIAEILRIYFRKDKVWNYEEEYRIVTKNHDAIDNEKYEQYLEENGSIHSLYNVGLRLKSVILGLNCCKKDEDAIRDIVDIINKNRLEEVLNEDKLYDRELMKKVMTNDEEFVKVKKIFINEDELILEVRTLE